MRYVVIAMPLIIMGTITQDLNAALGPAWNATYQQVFTLLEEDPAVHEQEIITLAQQLQEYALKLNNADYIIRSRDPLDALDAYYTLQTNSQAAKNDLANRERLYTIDNRKRLARYVHDLLHATEPKTIIPAIKTSSAPSPATSAIQRQAKPMRSAPQPPQNPKLIAKTNAAQPTPSSKMAPPQQEKPQRNAPLKRELQKSGPKKNISQDDEKRLDTAVAESRKKIAAVYAQYGTEEQLAQELEKATHANDAIFTTISKAADELSTLYSSFIDILTEVNIASHKYIQEIAPLYVAFQSLERDALRKKAMLMHAQPSLKPAPTVLPPKAGPELTGTADIEGPRPFPEALPSHPVTETFTDYTDTHAITYSSQELQERKQKEAARIAEEEKIKKAKNEPPAPPLPKQPAKPSAPKRKAPERPGVSTLITPNQPEAGVAIESGVDQESLTEATTSALLPSATTTFTRETTTAAEITSAGPVTVIEKPAMPSRPAPRLAPSTSTLIVPSPRIMIHDGEYIDTPSVLPTPAPSKSDLEEDLPVYTDTQDTITYSPKSIREQRQQQEAARRAAEEKRKQDEDARLVAEEAKIKHDREQQLAAERKATEEKQQIENEEKGKREQEERARRARAAEERRKQQEQKEEEERKAVEGKKKEMKRLQDLEAKNKAAQEEKKRKAREFEETEAAREKKKQDDLEQLKQTLLEALIATAKKAQEKGATVYKKYLDALRDDLAAQAIPLSRVTSISQKYEASKALFESAMLDPFWDYAEQAAAYTQLIERASELDTVPASEQAKSIITAIVTNVRTEAIKKIVSEKLHKTQPSLDWALVEQSVSEGIHAGLTMILMDNQAIAHAILDALAPKTMKRRTPQELWAGLSTEEQKVTTQEDIQQRIDLVDKFFKSLRSNSGARRSKDLFYFISILQATTSADFSVASQALKEQNELIKAIQEDSSWQKALDFIQRKIAALGQSKQNILQIKGATVSKTISAYWGQYGGLQRLSIDVPSVKASVAEESRRQEAHVLLQQAQSIDASLLDILLQKRLQTIIERLKPSSPVAESDLVYARAEIPDLAAKALQKHKEALAKQAELDQQKALERQKDLERQKEALERKQEDETIHAMLEVLEEIYADAFMAHKKEIEAFITTTVSSAKSALGSAPLDNNEFKASLLEAIREKFFDEDSDNEDSDNEDNESGSDTDTEIDTE